MSLNKKVRVMVVDDSSFFRATLIKHLSAHPKMEVIGHASDAFKAGYHVGKFISREYAFIQFEALSNGNTTANTLMRNDWYSSLAERIYVASDSTTADFKLLRQFRRGNTVFLKQCCQDSEQSVKFHNCPPALMLPLTEKSLAGLSI